MESSPPPSPLDAAGLADHIGLLRAQSDDDRDALLCDLLTAAWPTKLSQDV